MKILFVIKEEDPIDPMNVELLSALAKREGHETFLNVLQHRDLSDTLRRVRPDIIAYSGKTGEHKTFFKVNRFVKETYGDKIFTVMGGPHPTFNHRGIQLYGESLDDVPASKEDKETSRFNQRHTIIERSDMDAVCIGEGDDAWVEMLKALKNKESIDDIPNLITRSNRKKYPDPVFRERRIDLDDLPFYDRQLVYDKTFLGDFPMRSFMSSRGCPFVCTYCFNYDWNKTYREAGKMRKLHNRYSVDRLIAEIQDWRRLESERGYAPTQFIKFYDDMFEFKVTPWLIEFSERFPKEVGLPFFCLIRCDIFAHEEKDGSVRVNEDVLLLLKKAGLRSISMSIEAGNNFIRENILVRDMTEKEIRAAFGLMKKHKIGTFANTILGIPAPVIPRRHDPQFDQKLYKALHETRLAYTVAKKQVGRSDTENLSRVEKTIAFMEKNSTEKSRQNAVAILESFGFKYDAIDYDIQSVELNIDCGIHHTMFPRLDPYPGTVITDYTMAIGAFDGDFEKLHSSYDTTSSFTCFTDKQKLVQDNLSFLGQVCAVWPWLWPVAKKYLIYLPFTRLYWLMFLVAKTYVIKRHVYPMKFNFKNAFRSAYHVMLVEYKKFFQQADQQFYKKPRGWKAAASPTDVLGGRWEN
jgi:radical SAM superfamily enzyme YgiQ (UPF0313 family)